MPSMEARATEKAEAIFSTPETEPDRLYTFGTKVQKQAKTEPKLDPAHLA